MLRVEEIEKTFDGQNVLRRVSMRMAPGEIICLLGPSGCGKTTLLRIIAGLEKADGGAVLYDGQRIDDMPVHERGFGLMFQDFALFPHMNVGDNVAFGLKLAGQKQTSQQVDEMLALVGLSGYAQRNITQLSGGERQRVALARSLAPSPRLLMLDEPLGSLDAGLRERLALDLRRIIKQVGLSAVYVTHDQSEAFAIADRVAIMNEGEIEQISVSEVLYLRPATEFAARFLGLSNIIPVTGYEDGHVVTPLGRFDVGGRCSEVLVHPAGIGFARAGQGKTVAGQVVERLFQGDFYRYTIACVAGCQLVFRGGVRQDILPAVGDSVNVVIDPGMVIALKK